MSGLFITAKLLPHILSHITSLLLFDGHLSHVSANVIMKAMDEDVTLVKFPPHVTDLFQPLDVACLVRWKETGKKPWTIGALRMVENAQTKRFLKNDDGPAYALEFDCLKPRVGGGGTTLESYTSDSQDISVFRLRDVIAGLSGMSQNTRRLINFLIMLKVYTNSIMQGSRYPSKLCGLVNKGNTCYANSIVQSLNAFSKFDYILTSTSSGNVLLKSFKGVVPN